MHWAGGDRDGSAAEANGDDIPEGFVKCTVNDVEARAQLKAKWHDLARPPAEGEAAQFLDKVVERARAELQRLEPCAPTSDGLRVAEKHSMRPKRPSLTPRGKSRRLTGQDPGQRSEGGEGG